MDADPCVAVIKNLHRILEEEPSDRLCEKIRAHLNKCTPCRKQYEALEKLIVLCNRFPEENIPDRQKQLMKEELKKIVFSEATSRNAKRGSG